VAQFSDTTNKNGIIQKIEFITGLGDAAISGNSTLLKQFTGLVNDWLGVMAGDLLQVDGRYEWDDTNYTDQPIATFSLVADQAGYSFMEDANSAQILDITRVEVKNAASGDWIKLRPIDQREISQGYTEWMESSGIPIYYDFIGTVLTLFPASSYNSTDGAKVWFKREPAYFDSTDTTDEPGFCTPFQKILWLGPAYDYSVLSGKPNVALRQEIELERERLREFYSRRGKYEQPRLVGQVRSSR
jgi:hypothetical protein